MRSEARSWRRAAVVGIIAAVLAFWGAIQVRSQAEVVRSLSSQDSTALAFLIDDLHRANESLSAEEAQLALRREALRQDRSATAAGELSAEINRLKLVEGVVPVQGPGITLTVSAALTSLDLQDAINNLRIGGAEAIAINDRRVITGTPIKGTGASVSIDGVIVGSPWYFQAIGDPVRLSSTADQMTQSLRADARVGTAGYDTSTALTISAVVRPPGPFVYARP